MPYEKAIDVLQGGAVMAECGPMRLVISAFVGKVPQPEMSMQAAEESFKYLERVARLRGMLGQRFSKLPEVLEDSLAIKMIRSVLAVGDEDLTPMAAVAGTIGDAVADFLVTRGMTKVVVDNGGDVAVRISGDTSVTVGIRNEVGRKEISNVISLDSLLPSWGVTTSGLGGRSLTRGIASAATVIAESASLADAAATAIANASFVEDEHVIQRTAEEIDPETDIKGFHVTVKVGPLSEKIKAMAVSRVMERAEALVEKHIILGAYVAVQGKVAMTGFFKERLAE
ncbi:MAG: FAD:protein FMN transferase [Desulfobacteraceae bacterium]|nr:MAG: FAD:protein FMN transferase [Desulfobacteraceae bacterium]